MKTAKGMEKYTDKCYQFHIRKIKKQVKAGLNSAAKQGCYSHVLTFNLTNDAMIKDIIDWLVSLGYWWKQRLKDNEIEVFWGCVDSQESEW